MAGFLGIEPLFVDLREGKNAIRRILATATGRSFADMKGRMAARSFWETAPTAGFSFLGYLLAIPAVLVSAFLGLDALLSWAVTNEIDSEPDRALAQAICADIDMARTALASAETVGRIAGAALTRAIAEASKTCASSREW